MGTKLIADLASDNICQLILAMLNYLAYSNGDDKNVTMLSKEYRHCYLEQVWDKVT